MEIAGAVAARSFPSANCPTLQHSVEDLEYLRSDVLETLSRLEAKRGRIERDIASASRGRRAHHRRAPAAADGDALVAYTRKGAGAARKRLLAAAGDAKKERERLEALWGELEESLVREKERVALPRVAA